MSVAAGSGLLMLVMFARQVAADRDIDLESWAVAFAVPGFILTVTGIHMSLTWPIASISRSTTSFLARRVSVLEFCSSLRHFTSGNGVRPSKIAVTPRLSWHERRNRYRSSSSGWAFRFSRSRQPGCTTNSLPRHPKNLSAVCLPISRGSKRPSSPAFSPWSASGLFCSRSPCRRNFHRVGA